MWISIEQLVMVSGIVYDVLRFVVRDRQEQPSLLIIGNPIGALGRLNIFLILLKIGWTVSTCVRMTPVKSFLNQVTHSKTRSNR